MSSNYVAVPRALPTGLVTICAVLIAIGAVAFAAGLLSDPSIAWRAFHVNYLYFGLHVAGARSASRAHS